MATQDSLNSSLSGATGRGSFVGATSPTIITPVIAQINDANGNKELTLTSVASAVNYANLTNAATANNPVISALGSDTDVILSLQGKGTSGCALQSTQTNTNAPAGYMREYTSLNLGGGSAISLTNTTATTILTLSLTAGDWDVVGSVAFTISNGTTIRILQGAISTTAATINPISDTESSASSSTAARVLGASTAVINLSPSRLLLSATTNIYLIAYMALGGGAISAYGWISARRR